MIQIKLPGPRYAYGRVLRDAAVAFYVTTSVEPSQPPIGQRDFAFTVGMYDDSVQQCLVVGHDASSNPDEDWPPPSRVTDPITGAVRVYDEIRDARDDEADRVVEPAAVWSVDHVVERFVGMLP